MQLHQLMDACLFAVSFWLAYEFRGFAPIVAEFGPPSPFREFVWFYLILIPAAPLVLESQGFYNRPLVGPRRPLLWALFKSCCYITLGMVAILFLLKIEPGRARMVLFGGISFLLVGLKEELMRLVYKSEMAQSQYRRRLILVAASDELPRLRQQVEKDQDPTLEIVAELDLNAAAPSQVAGLLHEYSVNCVVINARHTFFEKAESVIKACEIEGVETWLVADFFHTEISRPTFDDFSGRPIIVFRSAPGTSWQSIFKSVLDAVGALVGLVVLSLIMIPVAIIIKLTSRGPIMFCQQRAGLNGAPFKMYKFRTMVTNAEQLKHELARLNEMSGPVFKITKDPRVTRIGRWLRKTSLDELPQLFNVLRGEMSLVGPRPLPVDEVKRFDDVAHRRRLSVKPGLTCLWQISGRNQISDFREWVRLDLQYIDNWSLWLDMKIILRTIPVVLFGRGAK
jgi:exopolysaccharide biosynthesis polyprenyl glycosylphosphotransferase